MLELVGDRMSNNYFGVLMSCCKLTNVSSLRFIASRTPSAAPFPFSDSEKIQFRNRAIAFYVQMLEKNLQISIQIIYKFQIRSLRKCMMELDQSTEELVTC